MSEVVNIADRYKRWILTDSELQCLARFHAERAKREAEDRNYSKAASHDKQRLEYIAAMRSQ